MKYLTVRIDEEILEKFRKIAKYEGRSANKQMLILIRNFIANFEKSKMNNYK